VSNVAITQLVAVCAGVFGLFAFIWLVAAPAVQSYSRTWEKIAAGFLTLYVLAALVGVGILGGAGVALWAWPRVFG
jgi:hypothetical protein